MQVTVRQLKAPVKKIVEHIECSYCESEFLDPISDVIEKAHNNPLSLPFGIFSGQRPIGFFSIDFSNPAVHFQKDDPSSCWLESFMISTDFQKKGYARAALEKICLLLKNEHPFVKNFNLTVNFRNTRARTLYLQCGFIDTQKVYQTGPAGPQNIFTKQI